MAAAPSGDVRPEMTVSATMVEALAGAMMARDPATQEHSQRVQRYAVALAGEVCVDDARLLDAIDTAALLHDIGKLAIPDRLLDKPGPLTADEYNQVKLHASVGYDILTAVSFPRSLALIVRHHHENWDGTGYPDRLVGEQIPIGARVLAIADTYDALTSDRPYRRRLSHEAAVAMIQQGLGSRYDPRIADAFLRSAERLRSACAQQRAGNVFAGLQASWLPEARAI